VPDLLETLKRAQRDLARHGARCCLVGGLAIGVRAEPRFTGDLDLAVAVSSDAEAEALVAALRADGYRILALLEQQTTGRLSTVRMIPPGGDEEGVIVDLLFAACGIEPEIVDAGEIMQIATDVMTPVARPEHLIAMKVLSRNDTRRPNDRADLVALLARSSQAQIATAKALLQLIAARGYERDKRLLDDLEQIVRESRADSG
jgi:predicted nucleotidyltransferase